MSHWNCSKNVIDDRHLYVTFFQRTKQMMLTAWCVFFFASSSLFYMKMWTICVLFSRSKINGRAKTKQQVWDKTWAMNIKGKASQNKNFLAFFFLVCQWRARTTGIRDHCMQYTLGHHRCDEILFQRINYSFVT